MADVEIIIAVVPNNTIFIVLFKLLYTYKLWFIWYHIMFVKSLRISNNLNRASRNE